MLTNQKDKFILETHVAYLNGAYMSPLLKETIEIGQKAIRGKGLPYQMNLSDFFDIPEKLKRRFAQLVDIPDYQNVAIIPSVSYGIATVANNVQLDRGDEILIVGGQFPSQVYSWQKLAQKQGGQVVIVEPPDGFQDRGKRWNENLLARITDKTAVVSIPIVHWADGTLFDMKVIRQRTKSVGALLIIDGTQSIGAMPFSVREIEPDALIVGGYKWLLGPYSTGVAYFSDYFNDGNPIEENWINRKNSEDFTRLVDYQPAYQPKAGRYSVGESSNFALNPMLHHSIKQLLKWKPENIQNYCFEITKGAIDELRKVGCFVEEKAYKGNHLFGVYLPHHIDMAALKQKLKDKNVFVSYRGDAVRVSPNVYNSWDDMERLVQVFRSLDATK